MTTTTLTQANRELFRRGADERFPTLQSLWDHCAQDREQSVECWTPPVGIRPVPRLDRLDLDLGGEGVFRMNDWSFGQVCKLAGVSKETLNKLSPDTACRALTETLPSGTKPLQALTRDSVSRRTHHMDELTRKLNPQRFPGMSPLMAAIVGFVLGESFTTPEIAEISVSETEGFVYIRKVGAAGFDGFQSLEDLRNNWNRLLDVAGLEPEERREAVQLFNAKVEKVSGTQL